MLPEHVLSRVRGGGLWWPPGLLFVLGRGRGGGSPPHWMIRHFTGFLPRGCNIKNNILVQTMVYNLVMALETTMSTLVTRYLLNRLLEEFILKNDLRNHL